MIDIDLLTKKYHFEVNDSVYFGEHTFVNKYSFSNQQIEVTYLRNNPAVHDTNINQSIALHIEQKNDKNILWFSLGGLLLSILLIFLGIRG